MLIDELLTAVRDLIEHEGRVAYRMLKRRFELDDEDIEDIKSDLIDAKRLARDEDGKVIVWLSDASDDAKPVGQELEPVPAVADRRLITVMFCDIVGSTEYSTRFDAEELREIVREYQEICAAIIVRCDGHVAQYLGDGLLVYFGYPAALEDEAGRSVKPYACGSVFIPDRWSSVKWVGPIDTSAWRWAKRRISPRACNPRQGRTKY